LFKRGENRGGPTGVRGEKNREKSGDKGLYKKARGQRGREKIQKKNDRKGEFPKTKGEPKLMKES